MGPRMIWGKRDELVAGSLRHLHAEETDTAKSSPRGWHRVCSVYPLIFRARPALFGLVLFVPSFLFFPSHAAAAENEDMAALRRMLGELKAENRKLSERLSALEGTSAPRHSAATAAKAAAAVHPARVVQPAPVAATPPVLPAPDLSETAAKRPLNERVRELEIGWAANENATRQILRDTLNKTGPKINNFLSL